MSRTHAVAVAKAALLTQRGLLRTIRLAFTEWQKHAFRSILRRNRATIETLQSELVVWRTMPVTRDPELYRDPAKAVAHAHKVGQGKYFDEEDGDKEEEVEEEEEEEDEGIGEIYKTPKGRVLATGVRMSAFQVPSATTSVPAAVPDRRRHGEIAATRAMRNRGQIERTPSPPIEELRDSRVGHQSGRISPLAGDPNTTRQRAFAWRMESPHRAREHDVHSEAGTRVRYGLGYVKSPAASKASHWQSEATSSSRSYERRQQLATAPSTNKALLRTSPEVASFIERTSVYYGVHRSSPYKSLG